MATSHSEPIAPTALGSTNDPGAAVAWDDLRCEVCGRVGGVAESERLDKRACWDCYHASFTAEEVTAVERIALQRELAAAIRGAVDRKPGKIADRTLLLETAGSADEALRLLDELRRLGVEVST